MRYSIVEMLKATVMTSVIPARARIVLNSLITARLLLPSNVGAMLSTNDTGRNMS